MAFKFESSEFKKVFGELLNFANRRNELDVANKELIQKIAVEIDVIKKSICNWYEFISFR